MLIDRAAGRECYALAWSYGEICVGCGCCSDDPAVRNESRLNYHKCELERCEQFDEWFDDPEIKELQLQNLTKEIEYHKQKVAEYGGLI